MVSKIEQRLAKKTERLGRQVDQDAPAASPPSTTVDSATGAVPPSTTTTVPNAPRTARTPITMPGQLGAFRQEAQKWTEQIAERDALIAERDTTIEQLKNATDRVQKIQLELVDDSPYQPRLQYDPEEIDALAKTMAAATQADPIKVRKVGNRYELIGGHRRKRAALSLGWTEIDAIVETRSDAEAELEAMLLVVANVKLSDFELAEMYQRALQKGFAKNKDKAAAMFGVTPSAVSGRLDMLSLPKEILDILRERPRLFSYTTAGVIMTLVQEHPKHLDIIVRGIRRLYEENAKQNALKGWILQAIAQQTRKAAPRASGLVVTKDGREVFTTKKTATAVTVNIKARNVDSEQLEKDLHAWLTQYAIDSETK